MAICVYLCVYNHGPVGNPVNHSSVSGLDALTCVPCIPRGSSLPAEPLCESEVSPLELPSALIWS